MGCSLVIEVPVSSLRSSFAINGFLTVFLHVYCLNTDIHPVPPWAIENRSPAEDENCYVEPKWSLMICGALQLGVANVRGINLSFLFQLYC